jgi:hypothetical protein
MPVNQGPGTYVLDPYRSLTVPCYPNSACTDNLGWYSRYYSTIMERRRDLRFEIQLKCRVQPIGGQHFIEAMTLNLSRSGALIRVISNGHPTLVPRPGDALWAEVPLPAHRQFKQRCLACKAVAVRTSEEKEGWVVALRFERVQFATAQPARSPEDTLAVM